MKKHSISQTGDNNIIKKDDTSPYELIGLPDRTITSRDLFGESSEIGIVHQGSVYRLRLTRTGKLILNK